MSFIRRPQTGFEPTALQGCLIVLATLAALALFLVAGVALLGVMVNVFRAVTGL